MAGKDKAKPDKKPQVRKLVSAAFPGDRAQPELSVAIVSLVELCKIAMPDPAALRDEIKNAGFADGPRERADQFGALLALDDKVFSFPVRNLKHALYARPRNDARVRLLLSEGESTEGAVVFVSTIFAGCIEADAVKAAALVTKKQPLTGTNITNAQGTPLRRVFWDTEGKAGIRGLMITGPQNVEALEGMRAFTAFNLAGKKKTN
jgi:hypothetical protein